MRFNINEIIISAKVIRNDSMSRDIIAKALILKKGKALFLKSNNDRLLIARLLGQIRYHKLNKKLQLEGRVRGTYIIRK